MHSNKFGVNQRCTPKFHFIPIWLESTTVYSNFNGVDTWTTPKYGCAPHMHHHSHNLWSDSATLAHILAVPHHAQGNKHNQGTLSIPHLIYIHLGCTPTAFFRRECGPLDGSHVFQWRPETRSPQTYRQAAGWVSRQSNVKAPARQRQMPSKATGAGQDSHGGVSILSLPIKMTKGRLEPMPAMGRPVVHLHASRWAIVDMSI